MRTIRLCDDCQRDRDQSQLAAAYRRISFGALPYRFDMDAHERFRSARVARLATVSSAGEPHLVPIVFTLEEDVLYTCVDEKPKSTRKLRRLDNIAATGRVSVLVDHYDEDWSVLWWVRVDGVAEILGADAGESRWALDALTRKYPQYTVARPRGPVIAVRELRWRSWSAR